MVLIGILVAAIVVVGVVLLVALYMALLSSLYPETIRTDEVFYVRTNDLWILRVCRYRKDRASGEPVLLVHGMGANQNNFTSPKDGCLVDYLAEKGYDCWTVDLRGCRSSEPPFERTRDDVCMEDFFKEDLPAVIEHILKITRYEKVHWIGHSMGGMLLYAYTLHFGSDNIASGTTLGSPIDFNDARGKIPTFLLTLAEKFPTVSGNLVRGLVPIMKTLHIGTIAFPINQRNLAPSLNAGHFINMLEDPLPLLMKQVRQWIIAREYKLLDGDLDVTASIGDLPVPLFAFFAKKDPFINIERAQEWFDSIKTPDKKMVVCSKEEGYAEDYSHCDLAFSKNAAQEIFDPIHQWLTKHECPVRASIEEEVKRFSASNVSDDKRARILSGNAYAHITDSEDTAVESEDEDGASDEAVGSPEPTPTAAAKATVKKKAATKKKPAAKTKAAAKKKPAAKKTAATKKTADAEKTPAEKKKSVAKKKATAKKKPVTKTNKVTPQTDPEEGSPSPEALQKANKEREARNSVFSELMASLSKPLDPEA